MEVEIKKVWALFWPDGEPVWFAQIPDVLVLPECKGECKRKLKEIYQIGDTYYHPIIDEVVDLVYEGYGIPLFEENSGAKATIIKRMFEIFPKR